MTPIKTLPWLCAPPADFRESCKQLAALSCETFFQQARLLASYRLNNTQLHQLSRAIDAGRATHPDSRLPQPLKLGLVSNGTTDLLRPALIATAARYGFILDVVEGQFGQITQEALDPTSRVNAASRDFVLVAADYRALPIDLCFGSAAEEQANVDAAWEWLKSIREAFHRNCGATLVMSTFAPPAETLFGSHDAVVLGSLPRILDQLNRRLADEAYAAGYLLLDTAALAGLVGLDEWHDATYWNLGKLQFSQDFVPLYADYVLRLLAAARGKSRKCLVLDLDNTVWGGVIGDDGIDGIVIGNGSAQGEAFLAVQNLALALRQRGILLAVSSKNEEQTARLPFQAHADMLLRETDITIFQANWIDKANNLRAIAKALSIGLDALVLLDDNPAERELVRQELPEVAVPELPQEAAHFPRVLAWAGYFEAVNYSTEDAGRAQYYSGNAKRAELAASTTDMDSYLRSLEMTMTVAPFDSMGRARIAQLINKTNQFNLTTRRYTDQQVKDFETTPGAVTMQARLVDKFGDNGMISVVIGIPDGDVLDIDTWLMSCRVLNRGVENATLNALVAAARAKGYKALRGTYIPTPKNDLVRAHYQRLGFANISVSDSATVWSLPLDGFNERACSIQVTVKDSG